MNCPTCPRCTCPGALIAKLHSLERVLIWTHLRHVAYSAMCPYCGLRWVNGLDGKVIGIKLAAEPERPVTADPPAKPISRPAIPDTDMAFEELR
jgi:hypothetical protein